MAQIWKLWPTALPIGNIVFSIFLYKNIMLWLLIRLESPWRKYTSYGSWRAVQNYRVITCIIIYHNDPKFSDRYAWASSADPDQRSSLIRVYNICHSVCIVWTHYAIVEPHSSNFRVITTSFLGVQIVRKFMVPTQLVLLRSAISWANAVNHPKYPSIFRGRHVKKKKDF